jgi:thioredoxin 1
MTAPVTTSFRMTPIDTHMPYAIVSDAVVPNAGPNAAPAAAAPKLTVPYVDAEKFAALVERAPGLVLVDFTADWCPPCRRLAPDIDALARELAPTLTIVKVDVDEQPDLASRFSVRGLPTLMFFRGGKIVDKILGAPPPEQIRAKAAQLRQ